MAEEAPRKRPSTDVVELQAELLEARANLYDTGTELPTVPVLLDQVRRMLDEHDAVRVYLVRIEQEQSLEAVVGWESYDALLAMVARYLNDVALSLGRDRSLLGIDGVRGDRFVLFVAGRRQSQELAEALQAPISVPGATDPRVEEISLRVGQGTIVRDPALRIERCIYSGIDQAARDFERRGEELDLERRHELTRILRDRTIRVLFQPIVRLPQRTVVGYEALSRGPERSYVEGAETLFGFAEREGLLGELERLCVEKALGAAHRLPLGSNLFINLSYVGMEFFDDSHGGLGHLVVTLAVFLFGLSTAISWSYYGDRSIFYLAGPRWIVPYRVVFCIMHFLGAVYSLEIVWSFGDAALGLMTVPNLLSILLLTGQVKRWTREYVAAGKLAPPARVSRKQGGSR